MVRYMLRVHEQEQEDYYSYEKASLVKTGGIASVLNLPLFFRKLGGSWGRNHLGAEVLATRFRSARSGMKRAGSAAILTGQASLGGGATDSNFDGGGGHQITEAHHIILQLLVETLDATQFLLQGLLPR